MGSLLYGDVSVMELRPRQGNLMEVLLKTAILFAQ